MAAAGLAALAACHTPARAVPITFTLTGTMTDASATGGWAAGAPFTSSYTFESTAAGVYNPNIRMTAYDNAVTAFSFTVASGTWTYPGAPPVNSNEINVQNDNYGVDRYLATFNPAMSTPPLPLGVSLHFIQFMFTDGTGTLLTNESLVTSASVLDAFGSKSGRFVFSNGDQPFFSISSIASPGVPETDPAGMGSVIALVTGALGLFERRRRRS